MHRRPRYQLALKNSPTVPSSSDNIRSSQSYSVMEAGGMCEERVTKSTVATVLKYICSMLCFGMRDIKVDLEEEQIVITDFVVPSDKQVEESRNHTEYNSVFH